jgi:nucleoside-diphosphate-sugar epimerase
MVGRTAVIHLAAAQHEVQMSDEHFRSVNVAATRLLLEAARAARVHRFVYGSTMGIHGSSESGPITEESEPRPLNIYTRTKLAAEGAVREFSEHIDDRAYRRNIRPRRSAPVEVVQGDRAWPIRHDWTR